MRIEKVESFNILGLSFNEMKTLKAIMQNPMCSSRENENERPCGECEFCKLSKLIFESLNNDK